MRLVSLCPSLTELLCDLDLADHLVGRTKFCIHPADAVGRIETVGGTKTPRIARILELAPDVVFMNREENRAADAQSLEAAGIRVHATLPRTAAEVAETVRSIGAVTGRTSAAERIAREIETRAARVQRSASGGPAVRFAYLIWRDPWMTVNGDTFVSALLSLPGGRNVFGDAGERYPVITAGQLREARPDVVLLSTEPFPFREHHGDELALLTGLSRDRIRVVDGELLSWHGSRTPRGIDYAEQVIREGARDAARPPTAG